MGRQNYDTEIFWLFPILYDYGSASDFTFGYPGGDVVSGISWAVLSTAELIGFRAMALAKHRQHVEDMRVRVDERKRAWLLKYEKEHKHTIKDLNFKPGDVVLVRNTEIESSDRKICVCVWMKGSELGYLSMRRSTSIPLKT